MSLEELTRGIKTREAVIGVVGLGYVGLPVACLLAEVGYRVIGLEIKPERVAQINSGISPIQGEEPGLETLLQDVVQKGTFKATTNPEDLSVADVITINVETPVEANHVPQYAALQSACRSLAQVIKPGAMVIVESTISPGTSQNTVLPIFEKAGKKLNQDFYLGVCPERVMPGKLILNLRTMSRVCGGSTLEVSNAMRELYRTFVQADVDVSDLVTAELVKTVENTYRDVQIAFANEVALICEQNQADFYRVRELVNKTPFRQLHLPGAGVGGHCIPKDPWLLAYSTEGNIPLQLIPAARSINDHMPIHIGECLLSSLAKSGRPVGDAKVAVLGLSYLEDSDDTRNSPTEALIAFLEEKGVCYTIQDPWVEPYRSRIEDVVENCDAVVVMVRHSEYSKINLQQLRKLVRTPILIDGRRVFSASEATNAGFSYYCVGQG
jgi:UDP-N-acetyl-D-mannosaminuronic acid dehydrogenase